ncbi:MAG TPA: inorganic phosphate transporter [Nitrospirae bacterium]|nr:inorganic phosphate transporter [Nitrospirota bacterium]
MGPEIFIVAVGIPIFCAVFDLVIGVSNDAANFLNSSLGSKVAPRHVIMIIASLGIIAGVTFSSGMMEVARKGIFNPQFFTMPELITIFLAVMLTDILLLDMFNTFGLPTSTTVSIVFELLGAAVAMSIIKVMATGQGLAAVAEYINTAKAMIIILGILMSVIIAFLMGAIVQFISRLILTFDYSKTIKRYGALWGGVALSSIVFFILIKGASGASFISPEQHDWIKSNFATILMWTFVASAVGLQVMISFFRINILKPIILTGTFALAMAFAANDLVNFIGVPLAGIYAYKVAIVSADPLNITMEALSGKVSTETYLLLIAGGIMVLTLWFSRKARSVSATEIGLGSQHEGIESFESTTLSRVLVRIVDTFFNKVKNVVPLPVRNFVGSRIDPTKYVPSDKDEHQSFDLVRAAVNLMVASAIISFATSLKLPLSTTYVTFMVAMGTSFSDRAWGRETAVYRVTGVITVISGWFMTAIIAFSIAFVFANIIYYTKGIGAILLLAFCSFVIIKTHKAHSKRTKEAEEAKVFNLRKIKDASASRAFTFEHMAYLLKEVRVSLDITFDALFAEDVATLRMQRKTVKQIQNWVNIITANIFKVLRLQQQKDEILVSYKYAQTIRRLQKLSDGHRDIVLRSYVHVSNHHKGLLPVQIEELKKVKEALLNILSEVEATFDQRQSFTPEIITEQLLEIRSYADTYHFKQIKRIQDESSKTRLSILFYAIVGNCMMLGKQNLKLLEIFQESFPSNGEQK